MRPHPCKLHTCGLHGLLARSKDCELPFDDLLRHQKIVVALKETIRLMGEIDGVIPSWPID